MVFREFRGRKIFFQAYSLLQHVLCIVIKAVTKTVEDFKKCKNLK